MKFIFTLAFSVLAVFFTNGQNYPVGKRTITFTDNSRNRAVPTDLYYPAVTAGNNTALAAGNDSFPVVVFGHGFLIGTASYEWLADTLVKNGYIVALPSTEGGLLPSHAAFGEDLYFLCRYITSLNDSSASFLYRRVIKKSAVGGHSMGGGASFLAAAGPRPALNALFNFAAAETNPSATAAAAQDQKPALIFTGSQDCIVNPSIPLGMYNNIVPCKTFINITGALHCQFANNNFVCGIGQVTSGCNSSPITAATVFNKTTNLLVPFLNYYLKINCTSGDIFVNNYNTLTGVIKQRACLPFPSCGVLPVTLLSFTGKLINNKIELAWQTALEYNIKNYVIERSNDGVNFNELTKVLPRSNNGNGDNYSSTDLYPYSGANFYRLKTVDINGSISYSSILKFIAAQKTLTITRLFPNPVSNLLYIQLQSVKRQQAILQLFDVVGKQASMQKISLNTGVTEAVINMSFAPQGTYLLQCKDEKGNLLGTFKIVKN